MIVTQLGFTISYLIFFGENVGSVLHLPPQLLVALILPIMILISWIRNLNVAPFFNLAFGPRFCCWTSCNGNWPWHCHKSCCSFNPASLPSWRNQRRQVCYVLSLSVRTSPFSLAWYHLPLRLLVWSFLWRLK